MATIRQLRGRWQAMVRRRGVPPRCKSFDKRTDATRWARELEAEADRSGWVADTRKGYEILCNETVIIPYYGCVPSFFGKRFYNFWNHFPILDAGGRCHFYSMGALFVYE